MVLLLLTATVDLFFALHQICLLSSWATAAAFRLIAIKNNSGYKTDRTFGGARLIKKKRTQSVFLTLILLR